VTLIPMRSPEVALSEVKGLPRGTLITGYDSDISVPHERSGCVLGSDQIRRRSGADTVNPGENALYGRPVLIEIIALCGMCSGCNGAQREHDGDFLCETAKEVLHRILIEEKLVDMPDDGTCNTSCYETAYPDCWYYYVYQSVWAKRKL
jgi:hypothetical protein